MAEHRTDNSKLDKDAKTLLTRCVAYIEKLTDEKQAIADYIADTYKILKAEGFDSKVVRKLVAERKAKKKDPTKWEKEQDVADLYRVALGMI